ncbi:MAG: type II secretion system F family protein [Acidobacteriota bacterium]
MPYFHCRLATDRGRIITQSFYAPSAGDVRRHFEERGLCVLAVKRDWKRLSHFSLPFERRIKDKDVILFNQEFVALIKAGYPVLKSIQIISNRIKNQHLKDILMKVEKDVREGKSLSEAFLPYEKFFSKVYTASLMAGERSGNLPETLGRYIAYAQVVARTKSRIRSALTYPTLLIFFSFILLAILLNFILPRFSSFYEDFEAQLPGITRALMTFSLFLRDNLLYFVLGLFILAVLFFQAKKKDKGGRYIDHLKLGIPYAGSIWLESASSLFSRTLSLLLSGGISLVSSVGVAVQAVPNKYLVYKMRYIENDIRNGENLSESMKKAQVFPPLAVDMARIGETSANLQGMLKETADVYDERIQGKIDTFVSLIEPVIIIFMGLLVAAMLLAVYIPIFNIIRVVR